ncbi:monovalent cation/H+ antiporter complex subunit F [Pelagicoccus mobilis]|uniref:Cation:proton antiporter n=1 Tax=Pelagicoccus mobilis TaxID=415221 RepID=A0A934VT08_9BACT|nr:monovalent cation/H+ antiporter complex subunit F [Pelagicoccus mobilis]MBK1879203.1 hypothetical protein [Pelagicoccus mobilis]
MEKEVIQFASQVGFALLSLALLIALYRAFKGPRATDRVVALDLLAGICLALFTLLAVSADKSVYLNVAVCISLLAFMSTAAFARYLATRHMQNKN